MVNINYDETDQKRNVVVLGTETNDYNVLNELREEMNDFITNNYPWFLMYGIATDGNQNK